MEKEMEEEGEREKVILSAIKVHATTADLWQHLNLGPSRLTPYRPSPSNRRYSYDPPVPLLRHRMIEYNRPLQSGTAG